MKFPRAKAGQTGVFGRRGKSRYPIDHLKGFSAAMMLDHKDHLKRTQEKGGQVFQKELLRQELSGLKPSTA